MVYVARIEASTRTELEGDASGGAQEAATGAPHAPVGRPIEASKASLRVQDGSLRDRCLRRPQVKAFYGAFTSKWYGS